MLARIAVGAVALVALTVTLSADTFHLKPGAEVDGQSQIEGKKIGESGSKWIIKLDNGKVVSIDASQIDQGGGDSTAGVEPAAEPDDSQLPLLSLVPLIPDEALLRAVDETKGSEPKCPDLVVLRDGRRMVGKLERKDGGCALVTDMGRVPLKEADLAAFRGEVETWGDLETIGYRDALRRIEQSLDNADIHISAQGSKSLSVYHDECAARMTSEKRSWASAKRESRVGRVMAYAHGYANMEVEARKRARADIMDQEAKDIADIILCPECGGDPKFQASKPCPTCGGTGTYQGKCRRCKGTGQATCGKCGGTGKMRCPAG